MFVCISISLSLMSRKDFSKSRDGNGKVTFIRLRALNRHVGMLLAIWSISANGDNGAT